MSETKAAVSVAEMARMVGLSRARFYQLQRAGIFPMPVKDENSKRPVYTEELQRICLEVRRRNCGVNGKVILFYAGRCHDTAPTKRPKKVALHSEVVEALKGLGLAVTAAQVERAMKELNLVKKDGAEVIRAVFLHLKRKDRADNVR